MKATKFWMTAAATVATAGMIGVAIAQTQQPVPPSNETSTTDRGSLPPSGNANSMNSGSTAGSSSLNTGSAPSDSTTNDVARADRG